jgi:hypothetical protein
MKYLITIVLLLMARGAWGEPNNIYQILNLCVGDNCPINWSVAESKSGEKYRYTVDKDENGHMVVCGDTNYDMALAIKDYLDTKTPIMALGDNCFLMKDNGKKRAAKHTRAKRVAESKAEGKK